MKRAIVFVLVAFLVIVAIAFVALRGKLGKAPPAVDTNSNTVTRGDLSVKVIESGTVDAVKAVEVRSRASGRLAQLLVKEGDMVEAGQLIAVIDPQETQFLVEQNQAQLRGAQSAVARAGLEIEQRRITSRAAVVQAEKRLAQLREEVRAQPTLTQTAIRQAQAVLSSAQKDRERLATSTHPNRRTVLEQAVDEARASQSNAQREYDRVRDLESKGYVAGRSLDNARLSLDLANVRLGAARDNLSRLETELRIELANADEAIKRAQADLDRANANAIQDSIKKREYESAIASLTSARANMRDVDVLAQGRNQSQASVSQISSVLRDSQRQLGETQIRAPMAGIVTKTYLEVGELVTALSAFSAGTSIVRIEDRREMMVTLNVNEIDVARLALGMTAKIDVDAIPDKTLNGRVTKIAPASNALSASGAQASAASAEAVVKYEVEIVLDGTDPKLRSGMSAKCTLEVISRKGVLLLPVEFVGTDKEGRFVNLPGEGKDAKPNRKAVRVGASSGAMIEITEGVKEGDKVLRPEYTGPKRQGFMQFGDDSDQAQEEKK
ncbi:MAG TPA: HlyD family efflux transporter periplasmic adaptor subunit, partial [Fimbriimonadaceae bacterium]|nr:HlyD family efflux transporter periplasmic adaptor subunit [Fimbriimonadaceae bacterium]